MKREEALSKIAEKLTKSKNLFRGYAKGNIDFKCLVDNLSSRILNFVEHGLEMKPPFNPEYGDPGALSTMDNLVSYYCWEKDLEEVSDNSSEGETPSSDILYEFDLVDHFSYSEAQIIERATRSIRDDQYVMAYVGLGHDFKVELTQTLNTTVNSKPAKLYHFIIRKITSV